MVIQPDMLQEQRRPQQKIPEDFARKVSVPRSEGEQFAHTSKNTLVEKPKYNLFINGNKVNPDGDVQHHRPASVPKQQLRFHENQPSPISANREHLLNQDGKEMTLEEAARLVEGIPDDFDSLNASEFFSKKSLDDEDEKQIEKGKDQAQIVSPEFITRINPRENAKHNPYVPLKNLESQPDQNTENKPQTPKAKDYMTEIPTKRENYFDDSFEEESQRPGFQENQQRPFQKVTTEPSGTIKVEVEKLNSTNQHKLKEASHSNPKIRIPEQEEDEKFGPLSFQTSKLQNPQTDGYHLQDGQQTPKLGRDQRKASFQTTEIENDKIGGISPKNDQTIHTFNSPDSFKPYSNPLITNDNTKDRFDFTQPASFPEDQKKTFRTLDRFEKSKKIPEETYRLGTFGPGMKAKPVTEQHNEEHSGNNYRLGTFGPGMKPQQVPNTQSEASIAKKNFEDLERPSASARKPSFNIKPTTTYAEYVANTSSKDLMSFSEFERERDQAKSEKFEQVLGNRANEDYDRVLLEDDSIGNDFPELAFDQGAENPFQKKTKTDFERLTDSMNESVDDIWNRVMSRDAPQFSQQIE